MRASTLHAHLGLVYLTRSALVGWYELGIRGML